MFSSTCAALLYRPPVTDWLQRWKFGGDMTLLPLFTELMQPAIEDDLIEYGLPDIIVPVPLHWWRQFRRGYNQAHLLAGSLLSKPEFEAIRGRLDQGICSKKRASPAQHDLNRAQRLANLDGAFHCRKNLQGASVAIVDDVMTTGATARQLAKTLLEAGASDVRVWCLARTP